MSSVNMSSDSLDTIEINYPNYEEADAATKDFPKNVTHLKNDSLKNHTYFLQQSRKIENILYDYAMYVPVVPGVLLIAQGAVRLVAGAVCALGYSIFQAVASKFKLNQSKDTAQKIQLNLCHIVEGSANIADGFLMSIPLIGRVAAIYRNKYERNHPEKVPATLREWSCNFNIRMMEATAYIPFFPSALMFVEQLGEGVVHGCRFALSAAKGAIHSHSKEAQKNKQRAKEDLKLSGQALLLSIPMAIPGFGQAVAIGALNDAKKRNVKKEPSPVAIGASTDAKKHNVKKEPSPVK